MGQVADSALDAVSMTDPPLAAKIYVPEPRSEWIQRSGLVSALTAAHDRRVVLLVAPSGYGKSTLVTQWRAHPMDPRRFAWVSLDRGDNDPVAMWTAILLSLHCASPELEADDLLDALRGDAIDLENVLVPRLLHRLETLSTPMVLVLDDYHLIHEPMCHRQLQSLIERLHGGLQPVLISRAEPPLALARYRASREMLELRMSQLCFTAADVKELARRVAGVTLQEPMLDVLVERTEGWPAGVYLAALSLRQSADPMAFIRDFAGTNRYIVNYLSDEVLRPLPKYAKRFLFRTSILERFTAPLCDAVAGTSNAAAFIGELERFNMFVIPLDDNGRWYRYHHLFREVLRDQLTRTEPGIVSDLCRAAAAWYQEHGHVPEAVEHALTGGDLDRAVTVLSRHWLEFVSAGRMATLRQWLATIGPERIGADPVAALCAMWFAALSGDREGAHRWMRAAEAMGHEGPLPDGISSLRSAVALVRGTFGFNGLRDMLDAAKEGVDLERDPTSPWYSLARADLGFAYYLSGDFESAISLLENAVENEHAASAIRVTSLAVLSLVVSELGHGSRAATLAQAAYDMVQEPRLSESNHASLAYTALGAALADAHRYQEAIPALEHALRIRRTVVGISPWPTVCGLAVLAEISIDCGETAEARELLNEASSLLARVPGDGGHLQTRLAVLRQRLNGPASPTPTPDEPLTDRERAVLRLLRGSLSQREIGSELFVSVNTVKTHSRAIFRKLGVTSRSAAVRRARELGLY